MWTVKQEPRIFSNLIRPRLGRFRPDTLQIAARVTSDGKRIEISEDVLRSFLCAGVDIF